MELAKLLFKVLYLSLLYFSILMFVKPMTSIRGNNLIIIVLTISVLFMYLTFDKLYELMTQNEIVIQKNDKDDDKKDKNDEKNSVKTEISEKVHKEASSDYLFDHTHKFIQNKVFD